MFKGNMVKSFTEQLTKPLENVKVELKKQLQEAEFVINESSQQMIPYDSGDAYESWFSKIEQEPDEMILTVGYDEQGQLDYLKLIHEVGPIEGGYGKFALAPDVDYTPQGFKLDNDSPSPNHYPQTKFLEKAMTQNWASIKQKLEVKFK